MDRLTAVRAAFKAEHMAQAAKDMAAECNRETSPCECGHHETHADHEQYNAAVALEAAAGKLLKAVGLLRLSVRAADNTAG